VVALHGKSQRRHARKASANASHDACKTFMLPPPS
jgi:hypothetical protein